LSKQAAAQRDAKSLAVIDSMSVASGAKQVGTKQFTQQGKVWTDQNYVKTQRTVQVKAFSPLYFELVNHSRTEGCASLGDGCWCRGGTAIQGVVSGWSV
jgi:hypothetical protein